MSTKLGLIPSTHFQDIAQKPIMASIKGHNAFANLRKMTFHNTNVDLVNDNLQTKLGLIPSSHCQDIEQSQILASINFRKMTFYNTYVDLVNDNL